MFEERTGNSIGLNWKLYKTIPEQLHKNTRKTIPKCIRPRKTTPWEQDNLIAFLPMLLDDTVFQQSLYLHPSWTHLQEYEFLSTLLQLSLLYLWSRHCPLLTYYQMPTAQLLLLHNQYMNLSKNTNWTTNKNKHYQDHLVRSDQTYKPACWKVRWKLLAESSSRELEQCRWWLLDPLEFCRRLLDTLECCRWWVETLVCCRWW